MVNFDSVIKSPTCEHYISLKSSWIHLIFTGKCLYKNNLTKGVSKELCKKKGLSEVLLLLTNTIQDKQLIGNIRALDILCIWLISSAQAPPGLQPTFFRASSPSTPHSTLTLTPTPVHLRGLQKHPSRQISMVTCSSPTQCHETLHLHFKSNDEKKTFSCLPPSQN